MPDYEANVDAPVTYWAGEYDAQALADSIGMSWTAPLWALSEPRIINVADLCSAPPPSSPTFTTTDMALALKFWEDHGELRAKLNDFVDAGLHRSFCHAVDVPPLPPVPTQPPPDGLPVDPPKPQGNDRLIRDIHRWTEFIGRSIVPRNYHVGDQQFVSGTGSITFVQDFTGTWGVWPAGVIMQIEARPDYAGRSNGGDFPVFYDLGWFSLANGTNAQSPIRVQHDFQMFYGSIARVNLVYYNLPPGVDVSFAPLYPDTPEPPEE